MAVLEIVRWPHEALSTPAEPVTEFDANLHQFLDDMAETMYVAQGVGLAANQVAVLLRVTVIDIAAEGEDSQLIELINPEVVEREGSITWQEGCLSFPDLFENIRRAAWVKVRYQNRDGKVCEVEGEELFGVAMQHEIDHLDGICFTDKLKATQKRMALKRFDKIMTKRRADGLEP